jgi:hypothetical protein
MRPFVPDLRGSLTSGLMPIHALRTPHDAKVLRDFAGIQLISSLFGPRNGSAVLWREIEASVVPATAPSIQESMKMMQSAEAADPIRPYL